MDYRRRALLGHAHPGLRPEVRAVDGVRVVEMAGDLDVYTGPPLRELLYDLAADVSVTAVVVDARGLTFLDSSGLSVLVGGLKRLRARGAALVLAGCRPSVQQIFVITGLTRTFSLYDTVEQALAAAGVDPAASG